jgi:hypothetical protein
VQSLRHKAFLALMKTTYSKPSVVCQTLHCDELVHHLRVSLGKFTCLQCGQRLAEKHKHTIVPLHKSNYVVVQDLNLLKGINVKQR